MDGRILSGVAVRRVATADLVARSRAALYSDDAIAWRLRGGQMGRWADGQPHVTAYQPIRPSVRHSRAHGDHRRRLTIQNASRDWCHRVAWGVGHRRTPRREYDHAAARQEPLFVPVALDLQEAERSGHGRSARARVEQGPHHGAVSGECGIRGWGLGNRDREQSLLRRGSFGAERKSGRGAGGHAPPTPNLQPHVPSGAHARAPRFDSGAVLRRQDARPPGLGGLDPWDSRNRTTGPPANLRYGGRRHVGGSRYNKGPPRFGWSRWLGASRLCRSSF